MTSSLLLSVVFCSLFIRDAVAYEVAPVALGSFGASTVSAAYGMQFDTNGDMLVAEYGNQIVSKFTPGGVKSTLYSDGTHYPDSICADPVTGNIVFGANSATVQSFNSITSGGSSLSSTTTYIQPFSCAFDTTGGLYVSDITSSGFYKSDTSFSFSTLVGTVNNIWTLYLDSTSHMYTADGYGKYIYRFDVSSTNYPLTPVIYAGTGTQNTAGSGDGGLAVSAVLGAGGFVTGDTIGNIFYSSRTDCTIRSIDPVTGIIYAMTGVTRQCGNSADGTSITSAKLSSNSGMRARNGVLYFTELSGTKIRTLSYNPAPSIAPTLAPTIVPTLTPSFIPTTAPTMAPTVVPSVVPTVSPTIAPTSSPTVVPTVSPSVAPSLAPTVEPTASPTVDPTAEPTVDPTQAPSIAPTPAPTTAPTTAPSLAPSEAPTIEPTASPTAEPSASPTVAPTSAPTYTSYISFAITVDLYNLTASVPGDASLDAVSESAYSSAVADVLGLDHRLVEFESQSALSTNNSMRVEVQVSAPVDGFADMDGFATYVELSNTLTTALADLTLQEAIRDESAVEGADVTLWATTDPTTAYVSPYKVTNPSESGGSGSAWKGKVAGVVIGAFLGCLLLFLILLCFFKRRDNASADQPQQTHAVAAPATTAATAVSPKATTVTDSGAEYQAV